MEKVVLFKKSTVSFPQRFKSQIVMNYSGGLLKYNVTFLTPKKILALYNFNMFPSIWNNNKLQLSQPFK